MATYVNDLRLKEITTGDESGTWGTSTNTNLELIAEAFSYGTEVITTNADTHTTTIDDGASDPGRSLYLKYTGTLDSACTITIGPNTVSKVWIIENGTSGSQDIIISQGSGANITIPAGDTKVVYSDGAGAGAAFFDAFASLSVVDLKVQDDLTVTGDIDVDGTTNLDVVDIDGAVDMATTLAVAGNVDFNGDLDVDGTTNLDIVDIDGAVDMASTLDVTGAITAGSGTLSGNLQIQAASSSAKLTVGDLGDTDRAAAFSGGSILLDGGAAFDMIIGDGNVAVRR
jgi:cytoskeletal protein CcmA (bactofilin family)